jgi:hypothetical protein
VARYLSLARPWFGLVAGVALLGVVIQLIGTATAGPAFTPTFDTRGAQVANVFAYFTILSNLLVGGVHLVLALRPERDSTLLRVLVLDAVVSIAVTGIVFNLVLAQTVHPTGINAVANTLCHIVTPLLAVIGWLLFGPRGRVRGDLVLLSAAYPLAWLAFTLVRGAFIGWYPYPFVDVVALGYGRVAINCVVVAVLFLGLGFGALALDRKLPGIR